MKCSYSTPSIHVNTRTPSQSTLWSPTHPACLTNQSRGVGWHVPNSHQGSGNAMGPGGTATSALLSGIITTSVSWGRNLPKYLSLVKVCSHWRHEHSPWFYSGKSWASAFYYSILCEEFGIILVMQPNRIIVLAFKSNWKAWPNSFLARLTFLMPEFICSFL